MQKPSNAVLNLSDDAAIERIHPEDRAKVLEIHSRLPGQKLATTVYNALFHELARPAWMAFTNP